MNIIFAEDDDLIRQLFVTHLEANIDNLNICEVASGNQAIGLIKEKRLTYDFIICDYNMPDGKGGEVFSYLQKNKIDIPFVLFSSDSPEDHSELKSFYQANSLNRYIPKPINSKNFLNILQPLLDGLSIVEESQQYRKIKLIYFYRFNKVNCDIFIKLSDTNYVKLLNKNTLYSIDDIQKYHHKGVKYLYVEKGELIEMTNQIGRAPFLSIDMENLNPDQKVGALIGVETLIHELVQDLGVTEQVVNLSSTYIDENINLIQQSSNELGDLLKGLKNRHDYIFDHTFLVSTLCIHLAQHINWDTYNTTRKLCAAALFHDIKINDPNLAMILFKDDEKIPKLSEEDYKQVMDHPRLASDLVNKIPGTQFMNVGDIILQHHETPDGKGFPMGLYAQQISPLSSAFILVHTLASMLYQVDFDLEAIPDIIRFLKENYNKGNFKSVVAALDHLNIQS